MRLVCTSVVHKYRHLFIKIHDNAELSYDVLGGNIFGGHVYWLVVRMYIIGILVLETQV